MTKYAVQNKWDAFVDSDGKGMREYNAQGIYPSRIFIWDRNTGEIWTNESINTPPIPPIKGKKLFPRNGEAISPFKP